MPIPFETVVDVLTRMANDPDRIEVVESIPQAVVRCRFDGWTLSLFDDAGELDYVISAMSPSGDGATFDDLWRDEPPHDPLEAISEPEMRSLNARLLQRTE